jgi:hypothetical protein
MHVCNFLISSERHTLDLGQPWFNTLVLYFFAAFTLKVKVKGKAVPLQAWSGPEGSKKLR